MTAEARLHAAVREVIIFLASGQWDEEGPLRWSEVNELRHELEAALEAVEHIVRSDVPGYTVEARKA